MNAHAQRMSAHQNQISPISPLPVKLEPSPPLSDHLEAPTSRATLIGGDVVRTNQGLDLASPTANSGSYGRVAVTSSSATPRMKVCPMADRMDDTALSRDLIALEQASTFDTPREARSSPSSSSNSGLKLRLRGIQAALKDSQNSTNSSFLRPENASNCKRAFYEASSNYEDDTDSEIDIMPPSRKAVKASPKKLTTRTTSRRGKKMKITHEDHSYEDDASFDAGDEDSPPASSPDSKLVLSSNVLKRSERMLDPNNPDHAKLIAAAPKAGPEYYDSDAEDLPGSVKDTSKPHLFRNVKWGALATDYSNASVFTTEPEFTQFVPGRFERLPDNTALDQKHKLIVRLTDTQHRQRIFANPPPRDWNNQQAITALNKRTVQQIRRNTAVRFREVVEPYVEVERQWILRHLTGGKPTRGWKSFVEAFNREFEGRRVSGCEAVRPPRSHSSLTKEVERFGAVYARGVVPRTEGKGKSVRKGRGGTGTKGGESGKSE